MQFVNQRQQHAPTPAKTKGLLLNMYTEPPHGDLSLEDFERFALDRLRVLKKLEEARLRSKSDAVLQMDVKGWFQKYMKEATATASMCKDTASHFILRLAYCRSTELRSWLLAQECQLFKHRLRELSPDEQVDFLQTIGLPYQPICAEAFAEVQSALATVAAANGDKEAAAALSRGSKQDRRPEVFRVPFTAVPDLVAARRVLVRDGFAYVGREQVASLVVGNFRAHLSKGLVECAKQWGRFLAAEGGRLVPLVEAMPSRCVFNSDRVLPKGEVTAGQVPGLAAGRHLPLCMHIMYERLAAEHHLKHNGRLELTLFLKAVGMPLEQALLFWRTMFGPRTSGDAFNKQYAYNIRYLYGQEGSRTDWSEWSCVKIISTEVGAQCGQAGNCNGGCPFKTLEEGQLVATLSKLHCSDSMIQDVVDKVRGRHYQLACGMAFEGIHGTPHDTGINKPSDYYATSMELVQARTAPPAGTAADGSGAETAAAAVGGTAAEPQGGN